MDQKLPLGFHEIVKICAIDFPKGRKISKYYTKLNLIGTNAMIGQF